MRKLNNLSKDLVSKLGISRENAKGLFIPELIDVITKKPTDRLVSKCPSSYEGVRSGEAKPLGENFQHVEIKLNDDGVDLSEICLVLEYLESDLDKLLKCKIDFG